MLDAAGYGIGYWARSMEIGDRKITVTEHDDTVRTTDYVNLRKAFGDLVDPDQEHVGRYLHEYFVSSITERDRDTGEIDAGHIDSEAADAWVQLALLNEVKYG
jgi:hypothetical protein